MKRSLFTLIIVLSISTISIAQLTGSKTIPGDYSSVASAIAALNTSGAGAGGIVFNIAAGYTETFTTPTDGNITTLSGSSSNPVTFQKSGTGNNPVITAAAGIGTLDAIIAIGGCDYITFDRINLSENAANTNPTTQMEFGYAILKATAIDGSRNITIKNCKITLNSANTGSKGIYSNNHTLASSTQLAVTNVSGTNSYLKIYSDTLSNCYTGIYLSGFNNTTAPYETLFDQNNEVGVDGANIVTNVAGGSSIAGYGIYGIYQNNLKVANNNITSTMGGSGVPYGIFLTTARNASYDLYNNYISMQFSGTGTTNFYPIYSEMGASGTNNSVNIYNNTVTGCTYPTVTSGNTYLMYLANLGVTSNIYNNVASDNIIGANNVTASGRIYYIYSNKSATTLGTLNIHDNSVTGNTRIQSTPGGGLTYFIAAAGTGSLMNMYNNSVTNNVVASNGGTYIIYAALDIATKNVYNNYISNITKAEGTVYGLYNYSITANSGTGKLYLNKVQNIEGLTSGSTIYGIYNTTSTGIPAYFYNNSVYDLRAPNALSAGSLLNSITGIWINSGSPVGVYNNSVYLNASSSAANFGSTALYYTVSATLDLRNNILINNSVPSGTGKTIAVRFSGINNTNFSATSNYNNVFAGTPASNRLLYFDGTNSDETLTGYKARLSPRELQSVSEFTPFINVTTTPYDLHLRNNAGTQCEAGGSPVTSPVDLNSDFDGEPRFPNNGYPVNGTYPPNAPDIGADELGGMPNDLTAPAIIYTPLGNINNGNARTLMAQITDGTGVPVSGSGLPVLYWKVGSGTFQPAQGVYVSGSTYSFTFGGGTSSGDIVSYYVAAQDLAANPNVGVYQWIGAAGFTASPPACSTPPNTPYAYTVLPNISGILHVGVGKDYPTLSAAASDISTKWISGPLTLVLDDATYPSETYPITFSSNPGSSPVNTLTIKPNTGVSPVFTSNIAGGNGLIHFSGSDYLIINGSNNGGNEKNLTFENTSTVSGSYTFQILSFNGIDPSTNITIKNCIIKGTPVHSSIVSIIPIRFSNAGGGFENCTIDHNTIIGGFDAIQIQGISTNLTNNCQVTNNIIGSVADAEAITHTGIYLQYANNTLISGNDIMGPYNGSLNTGQTGVYIGTGSTGTKIRKNRIHDFFHNSDDGWGASGIWFASDASSVTEISNNQIYDIKAPGINPGVGQNITYGIFVRSGGNVQILHNAIYLSGPYLSTQYEASSACIGFYYQATGNNNVVVNNILRNSMTPTATPLIYGKAYGIMISGTAALFTTINNNDYFIDGYNGQIAQQYTNGTGTIVDFTTLAAWQTFTGQESNGVTIDPSFTSGTYLLPTSVSLNDKGVYLTSVPTDFAGVMRNNPPDMGAYEFGYDPFVHTLSAHSITYNSAVITGEVNAAGTNVTTFFDYGTTSSYGTSLSANPGSVSGSATTPIQLALSGLSFATTYHYRARGTSSTGMISYGADSTFTTLPAAPDVITTAATSITESAAILNGSVNPNGGITSVTIQYGLTTSYGNTVTATPGSVNGFVPVIVMAPISGLNPYSTYHFRVVATNVTATVYGNDMTFTTMPVPSTVITLVASNVVGPDATLNGTVNANFAPTNVTFEWGLTTSYGNIATATPPTVSGNAPVPVSAIITGLSQATDYHFRCVGTGPGGTVYGLDQVFTSDCPTPAIPGPISGPQSVCENTSGVIYSIDPIENTTSYNWTVPSGATITSGANTNAITVDFSFSAVSGDITVSGNNSCGTGPFGSLAVTIHDLPVATISGPVNSCFESNNNVYSTEAGMTGYTWTVTGGIITAGAGTSSITVTWTVTGTHPVSVSYTNAFDCEPLTPAVMNVTVESLPAPTISGNNMACVNSTLNVYTTESGFSTYTWTVSPGGTIVNGQGTYQVEINWNVAGAQSVTVDYAQANGCSPSSPSSFAVTVIGIPATPGAITGTDELCAGSQNISYSVEPIPNTLNYIWTLPAGAIIVDGENTNNIKVDFAPDAVSGDVTVKGENQCGSGPSSAAYAVTVNPIPATPVVTVDENNLLHSSAPEGNQWFFDGTVIPGATDQDYQATEDGSYWTVVTLNGCSSEESIHVQVIFTGLPDLNAGTFTIYPVPSNGMFTVSVVIPGEETYSVNVYNNLGVKVYEMKDFHVNAKAERAINLENPSSGIYTVVLTGGNQTIIRKILVSR
jgi:trimeric autotransporter adhesin